LELILKEDKSGEDAIAVTLVHLDALTHIVQPPYVLSQSAL